jgi:uncharacterized membrane protein (Fun14 family)
MPYWRTAMILSPVLHRFSMCSKIPFNTISTVVMLVTLLGYSSTVCAGNGSSNNSKDHKKKTSKDDDFFSTFHSKLRDNKVPMADELTSIVRNLAGSTKATVESGVPFQVGYGFMMGYSAGFCVKKVSKVLSFAVGAAFILVQSLSFAGYIDVNYGRIEDDVKVALTTDLFAAVAINATQYAIYSFIGRLFLM